ncbi:hypothetical protein ONZ43_g2372 [Nemania bipapillata]|uniref:Uncharacterized protein n=1 Tax=Nemania bipapillata TaxID=110536 RepID=A0ACC2J176_9PEZI|nr:hypothetical protein ONZ43_g2372 [Nemania bipapillata]
MRSKSIVAVALVAAASGVIAELEQRPRIYFPRQVKRVFTNTTIVVTSLASQSSSSSQIETSSSTRRDAISDIASSLSLDPGTSSDDDEGTTTIIIPTTVFVAPSPTGSFSRNDTDTTTTTAIVASESGSSSVQSPTVKEETTSTSSTSTIPTSDLALTSGSSDSLTSAITNATSAASSSASAETSESTSDSILTPTSSGILLFPTTAYYWNDNIQFTNFKWDNLCLSHQRNKFDGNRKWSVLEYSYFRCDTNINTGFDTTSIIVYTASIVVCSVQRDDNGNSDINIIARVVYTLFIRCIDNFYDISPTEHDRASIKFYQFSFNEFASNINDIC